MFQFLNRRAWLVVAPLVASAGTLSWVPYRGHAFDAAWATKIAATVRDFVNDGVEVTAGIHTATTGPRARSFSSLTATGVPAL